MLTVEQREKLENLRIELEADITQMQVMHADEVKELAKMRRRLNKVLKAIHTDNIEHLAEVRTVQQCTADDIVNNSKYVTLSKGV